MQSKRLVGALGVVLFGCNPVPGTGRSDGVCVDSLDVVSGLVGHCSPTYAEALPWACASFADAGTLSAGTCGSFDTVLIAFELTDGACYYDIHSGKLVGAMAGDVTRAYCDSTTYSVYAGRFPLACTNASPVNPCEPDASVGTTDGGSEP